MMTHKTKKSIVTGTVSMTLMLAGMTLYGCGNDATETPSVDEAQVTGTASDAASTPATEVTDGGGEHAETTETIVPYLEPTLDELPTNRTADEIEKAIDQYLAYNFPDRQVASKELIGEFTNGNSDMWATYLIRFDKGDDVGLEVTCSSIAAPTVKQARYLKAANGLYYDVETKQNKNDLEVFGQSPEGAGATTDNNSSSDAVARAGGSLPTDKTESTAPETTPILVKNDEGKDVWVVMGDLEP